MSLAFFDENQDSIAGSLKFNHDGRLGGNQQKLIYIQNQDALYYYTDITLQPEMTDADTWVAFTDTGWSCRVKYQQRQPTEAEWNLVESGAAVPITAIGTLSASDTNFKPVWIRVYCPGGTLTGRRTDLRLNLRYNKQLVA